MKYEMLKNYIIFPRHSSLSSNNKHIFILFCGWDIVIETLINFLVI